jgi:hypothetical protein
VTIELRDPFEANLVVHVHPPDRQALKSTSLGELHADRIVLPAALLAGKTELTVAIS